MSELKPCPFCGGEGKLEVVKKSWHTKVKEDIPEFALIVREIDNGRGLRLFSYDYNMYLPSCEKCGCSKGTLFKNKNKAIEAWNTRADDSDINVGEIRAKAIDELVAEALKYFTEFDLKHGYPTVADCKIILHDVAEQMKGE